MSSSDSSSHSPSPAGYQHGQADTQDRWIKIISQEGHVRGVAIYAQNLVRHAAQIHGLVGFEAIALGEALIGGLLMASYCKAQQRINVSIQTTGAIRQCFVDAFPDGRVRGYLTRRDADVTPPHDPDRGPWAEGFMSVLRTHEVMFDQPYIGTVPLLTGHLAKDYSFYWHQSEQVPSAVGLCVTQSMDDGGPGPAGGFLVQAMPEASRVELDTIQRHIEEMPSLAIKLVESGNPMMLLSQIFQDQPFMKLEERPLRFECQCSWERVRNALVLLGAAELSDILKTDGKAVIKCDFCTKEYVADSAELQKMIAETSASA